MLQSCWQISSKVILLPIHYVICIFINKQVDIYSLAKLQLITNERNKYMHAAGQFPTKAQADIIVGKILDYYQRILSLEF